MHDVFAVYFAISCNWHRCTAATHSPSHTSHSFNRMRIDHTQRRKRKNMERKNRTKSYYKKGILNAFNVCVRYGIESKSHSKDVARSERKEGLNRKCIEEIVYILIWNSISDIPETCYFQQPRLCAHRNDTCCAVCVMFRFHSFTYTHAHSFFLVFCSFLSSFLCVLHLNRFWMFNFSIFSFVCLLLCDTYKYRWWLCLHDPLVNFRWI